MRKNYKQFFLIYKHFLILLISSSPLFTPAQTTSFISYGMDQGLAQGQVQSLTQDNEGNLWIGTIAGLTKYNGTKFISYTKNQGLAEDWVTCSYKDAAGNIWFGHWAGNVTRYNAKTKTLENLGLEEYTHFKTIKAIKEDGTGRYWIATEGAGIFIYEPANNKMFSLSQKDGLSSNTVYDFVMDPAKNVWIATDSGLTVYNMQKPVNDPESFIRLNTRHGFFSKNITTLYFNTNNELWIGSADKGLAVVRFDKNTPADLSEYIVKSQTLLDESKGLNSSFIKTIYQDHNGTMWVGTVGGGVSKFIPSPDKDRQTALNQGIFKTYSTRQGLNYFNVNTIFEDREQSLWIATDLGLNQFRGERMQIYDEADEVPNNIIWSMCNDNDNNIWLGTNNGLCKIAFNFSTNGGIESHSITNYNQQNGLSSNSVLACFQDSKGNMWFGTGFNGVSMLAKGASKFVTYTKANGLLSDMIYTVAEDKEGNIWFGSKEGATRFNPDTKVFRNYSVKDGLGGNHIYRIFKDSKGVLWLGALGGKLCAYDGSSFKTYDESNGLTHKFILSINEDKKGNLWFGCYGGGLYRFDGKTFINYSINEGLSSDSPFSIVPDNEGNIWIGNNRGIDKFDVKQNTFVHYGKNEGFPGVECNPNAACMDKKGNIWFGTIMGAVKFNPNEDLPNKTAPLTQIFGLKIHLKDTLFPAEAEFKYNQNNITFKFIGVSLTNPKKVNYEYSLEGFDHGWIPANYLVQEAVYTNLPPGKYTFKVRACNNDGVWSEPTTYNFTVQPPFWQTALFYVSAFIFIVFAIYVYDQLRTRNLKLAKAALEKKVQERTIELAIKNEELAEKNKDITDSIRYAKRIQDASLTGIYHVKNVLQQSFIFFKPKDIVSGDFFWIKQRKESIYFAAIDCTGHGVPGAILSIVANNILNKAFEDTTDGSPAAILNRLTLLASTALQSSSDTYQLRDGMDIALCRINTQTKQVEFAGAYNSLYLIRQNKLIEYVADHLSIGNIENSKPYTNHSFGYETNDQLYLFSDGFPDQFGGEKGKKYKYSHFQEFLVKNNNLPVDEQRAALEKEFGTWKGKLEQIDDVLIMGVRL